jgi:hypothetical protein
MGYRVQKAEPPSMLPFNVHNISRLLYFHRLLESIKHVEGDIVECGVGSADSLLILAQLVREEDRGRKIWAFDSFEGLPEPSKEDMSPRNPQKGQIAWSVYQVQKRLLDSGVPQDFFHSQITLIKGYFEDTLSLYRGRIALLHLDVDLYDSYQISLKELYPKVETGGIVAFDEYLNTYEHLHWPGARRAIDEFLGERRADMLRDDRTGKYYFVKPDMQRFSDVSVRGIAG